LTLLLIEGFDNANSAADMFAGILTMASATSTSLFSLSTNTEFTGKCLTVTTGNPLSAVTFSRASTATYYNSSGIIQVAALNTLRINYSPPSYTSSAPLIETAATNLLTASATINGTNWANRGNPTFTSGYTAPDGSSNATLLSYPSTANNLYDVYQFITTLPNTYYTLSSYAKDNGNGWVHLQLWDFGPQNGGVEAWYNLTTGTVGTINQTLPAMNASATITSVGNGWYRLTLTGVPTPTAATADVQIDYRLANANNSNYPGIVGYGTIIWGTQVELGPSASSYIPTTSVPVTRAADVYHVGPSSAAYVGLHVATASSTVVVGTSISLTPAVSGGYDIGITNGMVCQIFCRFILNGVLIYRGDPVGTYSLLGSALTGLVSSGWAYVEIKVTIGTGVSGAISVYVNGTLVANLTGLNTSYDGTTAVNGIALGAYDGSGTGFTASYDNVYALDTLGIGPNNGVLGPTRVVTRLPTANASVSFAPLANSNWLEVSDASMDGNFSYNYSVGIPSTDTYVAFALPTTTSEIFGVQVKAAVRKNDAGSRVMTTAITSAGTSNAGASVALSPNYVYITDIYPLDPHTASSWTVAAVNLSTFGYTVLS
jgi:hypothetical protein